jgi:hypothetical protein
MKPCNRKQSMRAAAEQVLAGKYKQAISAIGKRLATD